MDNWTKSSIINIVKYRGKHLQEKIYVGKTTTAHSFLKGLITDFYKSKWSASKSNGAIGPIRDTLITTVTAAVIGKGKVL